MTAVLYIGCWSLREPQCQRLSLDPLRGLAREGFRIHLLTWERPPYRGTPADERRWKASLRDDGITWYPLRYHHRPLLLAKLRDGLAGVWAGWRVLQREPIAFVHARSELPAVVGAALARLRRMPILYESDAPISEERVDVGVWRRSDFVYRVTRAFERWLPGLSREMIVLSRRYAQRLRQEGADLPITVLPACTDVERFRRDPAARAALRAERGWSGRLVLVYSGQISGWYQFDAMADFFGRLRAGNASAHFLCLVNDDPAVVRRLLAERGIPDESATVTAVAPEEVPRWLAASDIALAFIRSGTSKFASSPTKVAEYLACGLPVIMTAGVGDTEELVADARTGHVLHGLGAADHAAAIEWIERVTPHLGDAAERCRRVAVERLSVQHVGVPTYAEVYRRLAAPVAPDLARAAP